MKKLHLITHECETEAFYESETFWTYVMQYYRQVGKKRSSMVESDTFVF